MPKSPSLHPNDRTYIKQTADGSVQPPQNDLLRIRTELYWCAHGLAQTKFRHHSLFIKVLAKLLSRSVRVPSFPPRVPSFSSRTNALTPQSPQGGTFAGISRSRRTWWRRFSLFCPRSRCTDSRSSYRNGSRRTSIHQCAAPACALPI